MPTNITQPPPLPSSLKPHLPRSPFPHRGPGAMSSAPADPRPAGPPPSSPPPQPQPPPLLKQHSWSPNSDRDEAWVRRQDLHRLRNRRRSDLIDRSVTDDDLDELRGCIELGFGFEPDSPDAVAAQLSRTIPALDLYFAVHRKSYASVSESLGDNGSSAGVSAGGGSPVSIFDPGDSAEVKKARLRQWAQVVACSVRQHHR